MKNPVLLKKIGLILGGLISFMPSYLHAEAAGVVQPRYLWTAADTKTHVLKDGLIILRVCWDIDPFLSIPGNQSTFYWKQEVQNHIQRYWNGYAGIKFVFDENPCDLTVGHDDLRYKPDSPGVDWRPSATVGKGAVADQAQGKKSVTLCWTFKNYAPGYIGPTTYSTSTGLRTTTYDASYHRASILSQATHEFGHVLGLAHEQTSVDAPESCREKVSDSAYQTLSLYDSNSIMNYCNPNYGLNQYTPSCTDIATIRAVYGLHPTEKKDVGCILQCASGLDDNLAKTGASLAACKLPTAETIIGSLAGLTPQVEYPGLGGGGSPPGSLPPNPGTPSGVKAIINMSITKTADDNMTVNITTANGSEFYGHQVWIRRINGWLNQETANTASS